MDYLAARYDPWLLVLSIVVAGVASYVARDFARRMSQQERHAAMVWWAGVSVAMGAGIWSMHFVGMLAFDLPVAIGHAGVVTFASCTAAVMAATAGLAFAGRGALTATRLVLGVVAMGAGICTMHCIGSAALSGRRLEGLVAITPLGLLAGIWLVSALDGRMRSQTLALAESLSRSNAQLARANEELRRRSCVDPLTELPNRKMFEDRLTQAVAIHRRTDGRPGARCHGAPAVLFIDLDGFKPVNDSCGHAVGDLVLKEVARRLCCSAQDGDTVARIGGDEFLLLMEDVATLDDCTAAAARLCKVLRAPMQLGRQLIEISASIGIAAAPDHGECTRLIANADAAMHAAKRAGGNGFALFEARMDVDSSAQLSLQAELRHAAERGQLMLYYQPKVDSQGGQIHSVEALLRWRHPQRGLVGPAEFIPLAERFGFITQIGQWVIEEACRQMHEWSKRGIHIRVAINLSAQQLRDAELVARIDRAIRSHGIAPDRLLCEITESVAMEDLESTQRVFNGLAGIGIFLSIDDFGTGYSSLGYLRRLPAKQLKIDRSFVQDLETSQDARAIVDAVVQLAHALALKVVAEGVETEGQRRILVQLGCDELQGFLFARPMPAMDLLDWMLDRTACGEVDFAPSVIEA